jgi:DNA-binding NarL/FixJ family response regulator
MTSRIEVALRPYETDLVNLDMFASSLEPAERMQANEWLHGCIIIIDSRALERECLAKGLMASSISIRVFSFESTEEWQQAHDLHNRASAILLALGSRDSGDAGVQTDIANLVAHFKDIPIIAIGDLDGLDHVRKILEYGARSYIPTSVGLDGAIEAIRLARAGGTSMPALAL